MRLSTAATSFVVLSQCVLESVTAQGLFSFPSCSICQDGLTVTNLDVPLPINTAGVLLSDSTCGEVAVMAAEGDYSPFACSILRSAISASCGCGTGTLPPALVPVPVTLAPASAPTIRKLFGVTYNGSLRLRSRILTPLCCLLAAPVPAPTLPPGMVSSPIVLQLDNIRGDWTPEAGESFEIATETYLEGSVEGVTDVDCTVDSTTPVARRFRMRRRGLQDASSLFVTSTCTAVATAGATDADFSSSAREALTDGNEQFIGQLATEAPFFEGTSVASVDTSLMVPPPVAEPESEPESEPVPAPEPVPAAPVPAPTALPPAPTVPPATAGSPEVDGDGDGGGLGGGAIFGIVIAVIAVLGCIGAAVFFAGKGRDNEATRSAPAAVRSKPVVEEVDTDMLHPPPAFKAAKVKNTPVAAAAAVAAAATGDPSVIKGESTIAGEGGEASTVGGESTAMSSLKTNMLARQVEAPPGKLGIVIDTTLEGPVVHKISDTSPLKGSVFEGDIIVAINEVDTRAMSASAITALMGRTASMRRDLTILSQDIAN